MYWRAPSSARLAPISCATFLPRGAGCSSTRTMARSSCARCRRSGATSLGSGDPRDPVLEPDVRRPVAIEPRAEVGLEVLEILKTHMDAEHVAALVPIDGGADAFGVDGQAQALISTPGIAHPEQLKVVDHFRHSLSGRRLEQDGK